MKKPPEPSHERSSQGKTLAEVCEFIADCEHKTAPTQPDGIPLIRTPNIGNGRLKLDSVLRVSESVWKEWTRRAAPRIGDLIIAREAPVGNVSIVLSDEPVCLGQRTVLARPKQSAVDPAYLCYLMNGSDVQGAIHGQTNGSTVPHLNLRDIRNLLLPTLPPLPVQRRIASVLSAYDDLIENNAKRIRVLEDMARSLYREWFVHFRYPGHEGDELVGAIPQGWQLLTLGDRVVLHYGKALKADTRTEGPYPVYGSSGIVGVHGEALTKAPGIVVGRKGHVGSVFWCTKAFWPIDTVYYIDSASSNLWLYYSLREMQFLSSDAAVPGLNRDFAYRRPLLIPPAKLVEEFLRMVNPVHEQIENLTERNTRLRTARDLLLPQLLSGRLSVDRIPDPVAG